MAVASRVAASIAARWSRRPVAAIARRAQAAPHAPASPLSPSSILPRTTSQWCQAPLNLAGARAMHKVARAPLTLPLGAASHLFLSTSAPGASGAEEAADGVDGKKEDEEVEEEDKDVRTQLLDASMKHVLSMGWTQAAISQGAQDMNLSPAVSGILERGEVELVEHFIQGCNREFAALVAAGKGEIEGMPMRARLGHMLRMRLEMVGPYIATWPQAIALLAEPRNAAQSVQTLAMLVDDVWHAAGDQSMDSSWYTKRATLAALYSATEVYMLTDFSPGFEDTWAFLDRRLDDLARLGGSGDEAGAYVEAVLEGLGATVKSVLGKVPGPPGGPGPTPPPK